MIEFSYLALLVLFLQHPTFAWSGLLMGKTSPKFSICKESSVETFGDHYNMIELRKCDWHEYVATASLSTLSSHQLEQLMFGRHLPNRLINMFSIHFEPIDLQSNFSLNHVTSTATSILFDRLTTIKHANLTGLGIETLNGRSESMRYLKSLILSHNNLASIDATLVRSMNRLEVLHLDHNPKLVLDSNNLAHHSSLRQVSLASNGLRTMPDGLFLNVSTMNRIDLRHNSLHYLDMCLFDEIYVTSGKSSKRNKLSTRKPIELLVGDNPFSHSDECNCDLQYLNKKLFFKVDQLMPCHMKKCNFNAIRVRCLPSVRFATILYRINLAVLIGFSIYLVVILFQALSKKRLAHRRICDKDPLFVVYNNHQDV